MTCNQAVILVGGRGTRLGEIAAATPKPMMPITETKVFLDYLLTRISEQGFTKIILLAGHLGMQIVERYNGIRIRDSSIFVVVEKMARGTGGALLEAFDRLDDRFLLMNGDTLFDVDLRAFADQAPEEDSLCTLLLREVDDVGRYGSVVLNDRIVTRFSEKDPSNCGRGLISAGIYVTSKAICSYVKALPCSIETDVFPALASRGELAGCIAQGYFIDIGLPGTLAQARSDFPVLFPDD